jgi:hypothetical protein
MYRWLLRLYPKEWRARYEDEVAAVLDQHGCTPRTFVDLVLGAIDARLILPHLTEENLVAVNLPSYPGTNRARPGAAVLTVAVAALSAAFFLLLAYTVFVGFPSITQTGDANLQRWVGPDWARWGYLALGLVVAGAYGLVAIRGNLDAGHERSRSVLVGAITGGVSGLLAIAVLALVTLIARDPAQLAPTSVVILPLLLLGPAAAGVAAGADRARRRGGPGRFLVRGGLRAGGVARLAHPGRRVRRAARSHRLGRGPFRRSAL